MIPSIENSNATCGLLNDKTLQREIRELSKISFPRAIVPLIVDWLFIGAAIYVLTLSDSLLVYIVGCVFIASRQHALLVMVHEGSHYRLAHSKRMNDFISNVFAAYPIFFCTNGYRANHLAHHYYLNSDQDPDWSRKIHLKEWQFPQSYRELLRTFACVFFTSWYKMIFLFWNLSGLFKQQTWKTTEGRRNVFLKVTFYTILIYALSVTEVWMSFLLYWVVPYLLFMPIIERIRSMSEHFALEYKDDYSQTRNILCSPSEAFFIGPHHIRFHLDHHLFPTVPQYNLPRLHRLLSQSEEFRSRGHENDSYFFGERSVLADLIGNRVDVENKGNRRIPVEVNNEE